MGPKRIKEDLPGSVKQVTVLDRKDSKEAISILKRCIKCALKVMEKRKWIVQSVNEFVPVEDNLLGLNINRQKIMIRLRVPHKYKTIVVCSLLFSFFSFVMILEKKSFIHSSTHWAHFCMN